MQQKKTMKNEFPSMNTDKLGLSEEKANEYVNSLVPTNNDFIGAVIEQINDSKYTPNYVKYHDGEKWVEVYSDSETVFTKEQMIDLGISNNIPELMEKHKKLFNWFPTVLFTCVVISWVIWGTFIYYCFIKK